MATKTVTDPVKNFKEGIDRAANRMAFILEGLLAFCFCEDDKKYLQALRCVLRGDIKSGMSSSLTNVYCELRDVRGEFFPENGELVFDDLEGELCNAMNLLQLIFNSGVDDLDFPEKASDRLLLGLVETMRDIYNQLVEISSSLEQIKLPQTTS